MSGQALVYLYHLVNRATSCETGDKLGTTSYFTWGTSLDYKQLKDFLKQFNGNNVALKQATLSI